MYEFRLANDYVDDPGTLKLGVEFETPEYSDV
jgi:hypothetical protein